MSIRFRPLLPLAKPGGPNPGPAWNHTDTPAYLLHSVTGEHLLYNTVRPRADGAVISTGGEQERWS